jgi:hypothetical protein
LAHHHFLQREQLGCSEQPHGYHQPIDTHYGRPSFAGMAGSTAVPVYPLLAFERPQPCLVVGATLDDRKFAIR